MPHKPTTRFVCVCVRAWGITQKVVDGLDLDISMVLGRSANFLSTPAHGGWYSVRPSFGPCMQAHTALHRTAKFGTVVHLIVYRCFWADPHSRDQGSRDHHIGIVLSLSG